MEFNETQTMAINFTKMAKEKMGDKVKDFCILDVYDERTVALSNSQQWWEEADFDVFFKELERELKLRIPDKFLKAHRWR